MVQIVLADRLWRVQDGGMEHPIFCHCTDCLPHWPAESTRVYTSRAKYPDAERGRSAENRRAYMKRKLRGAK